MTVIRSEPQVAPYTEPYWAATQRGELVIQRCQACGRFQFPPFPICPTCSSDSLAWIDVSGKGAVHSVATVVHDILPGLDALLPLQCALVQLDESPDAVMPTNIVGDVRAHVGDRVHVEFEAVGNVRLPVFRVSAHSSGDGS